MSHRLAEKVTARRALAGALIVLGAVLIWLAPETWAGAALLALGVLVELVGVSISHQRRAAQRNSHDSP
jgi:drug/metabolite transporter (DMT)-like permease